MWFNGKRKRNYWFINEAELQPTLGIEYFMYDLKNWQRLCCTIADFSFMISKEYQLSRNHWRHHWQKYKHQQTPFSCHKIGGDNTPVYHDKV